MYALVPKYTADAMPITTPMRTVWLSSQDGHQRAGSATRALAGAFATSATAIRRTTADHAASAHRQSPCASGSTPAGVVSAVGTVSPIRTPLLNAAVASAMRLGNHSRTSDGKAGWL